MYQKLHETPSEWIQSFRAIIKLVEATGGTIGVGEHVYQYLADLEDVDLTKLRAGRIQRACYRIVSSPPVF
jgi:hypothetical protein